jgi:hypothetical protein
VVAIAVASSPFAFLNGGALVELIATGIGGATAQGVRSWLLRSEFA